MRKVTYNMGVSADGYIYGPDGSFGWGAPSDEVFRYSIEQIQLVGVHLLGRPLYEAMRYWETAVEDPDISADHLEWAGLWNPLPKVVFSRTLTSVDGSGARLATGSLADEIAALKANGDEGDIAIGGADLAAHAAALDLIDEYRYRIYPVIVGGGQPFFARGLDQIDLELFESRTFDNGVVALHQRVVR